MARGACAVRGLPVDPPAWCHSSCLKAPRGNTLPRAPSSHRHSWGQGLIPNSVPAPLAVAAYRTPPLQFPTRAMTSRLPDPAPPIMGWVATFTVERDARGAAWRRRARGRARRGAEGGVPRDLRRLRGARTQPLPAGSPAAVRRGPVPRAGIVRGRLRLRVLVVVGGPALVVRRLTRAKEARRRAAAGTGTRPGSR
eukprot:gene11040-biopygen3387